MTNYDFTILDLSEAPSWQTDLNSRTLSKAQTNLFKNGKLRSDRRAAYARSTRWRMKCAVAEAKALESAQKANKLITEPQKELWNK